MSNILTGVLSKVQAQLPDQIGSNTRWDTETVQTLIVAADRATRDKCDVHYATQTISLVDDTVAYDVAANLISIDKVEFSLDGTNYDWILQSRSMADLDRLSHSWRNDRSTRPDFYTLLSAPGTQDNGDGNVPAQILLYPTLESAGSATLKLTGIMVPALADIETDTIPDDVQNKCHVPYVMSVLYSVESPERSAAEWQKFLKGCEDLRNRFRSQYRDHPSRPGGRGYQQTWTRT